MADKKDDEDHMINKKDTDQRITLSDEQIKKISKEQFNKYRETFKKLAKN